MEYFIKRKPPEKFDYEEKYWGTVVDPDGNIRDRLTEKEQYLDDIKQEMAFLNSLKGGKILDIGCGPGFLLSGLGNQWEKFGIEISKYASKNAKQYATIYNNDLISLSFEDECFDAIVMYHVVEHLEDPLSIIKEVKRILKPKGVLLIATPDFDCACARRFGENFRLLHDKTHISLFTNESMHRFLRDNGFIIDKVEYPFFDTRHFTSENMLRMFDTSNISPPFYGNFMTFYCHKN